MNEVSLKPVIEELENLFSKFNARFFADKLEKPVITVSPDHTRGAYGWCTGWKAWKAGEDEGHYPTDHLHHLPDRQWPVQHPGAHLGHLHGGPDHGKGSLRQVGQVVYSPAGPPVRGGRGAGADRQRHPPRANVSRKKVFR